MALLGNFDSSYTRSGNGMLTRWANKLSFIPVVGGFLTAPLGFIGTALESLQWLLKGKVLSAATVAVAGTVGTTINAMEGAVWWMNAGSGITTGRSIGTHGRKLTESIIGGVTGALGVKPTVLQSNYAGIGAIGGMSQPGPGRFLSEAARSRGEDPNAAYARLTSNQADHLAALQSAGQSTGRGM